MYSGSNVPFVRPNAYFHPSDHQKTREIRWNLNNVNGFDVNYP